jgi:F0F1-type ATP synthase epsilon subunit
MFRKLKTVMVELSTPQGSVFSGHAGGVDMRATDGAITITPREESYLNLTRTTEITLRVGTEFIRFVLKNAAASLREGRLTVLAEEIHAAELPACGAGSDI